LNLIFYCYHILVSRFIELLLDVLERVISQTPDTKYDMFSVSTLMPFQIPLMIELSFNKYHLFVILSILIKSKHDIIIKKEIKLFIFRVLNIFQEQKDFSLKIKINCYYQIHLFRQKSN
jgi:hypothetical protein